MGAKSKAIKIILPILILIIGFVIMRILILSRQVPQRQVIENPGALVEVLRVKKIDRQLKVFSTGTVQPEQEVTITLQVSGVIDWVAPGFIAGAFFQKGELLFGVETIDYELAVEQARANLIRAENEIIIIESKAAAARQEWERLKLDDQQEPNPLIVYEPQLEDAKANRSAALARLRQAELDLQRTRISAPFNCLVRSEEVGVGKFVRAGNNVAMVAGVDSAEIIVPLPLDELSWLSIPGPGSSGQGSIADVHLEVGGRLHRWQGELVRSLGEVDLKSRMARVAVKVKDPYGLHDGKGHELNLEFGMFVEVVFEGEELKDIVEIPRAALREDATVWVMGSDRKLDIVPVEVIRQQRDTVLIGRGLEDGSQVILTTLQGVVEGMKLRPVGEGESR